MALDEFARIETYFAPLATADGAFGLGDDAALLSPRAGYDLVLTQDAIVESVHFLPSDPPDDVARKLLRCNISDLAAKGARPVGYLLTCAWTSQTTENWIESFAEGLRQDQEKFDLSLLGGDTVRSPGPLSFSLTAIGEVPEGGMIRRKGAQAGDWVFVTGSIGQAGLGLAVLSDRLSIPDDEDRNALIQRYRFPEPRLQVGLCLQGLASAALDVSDGLVGDAMHLAQQSGVGLSLELEEMPFSDPVKRILERGEARIEDLLSGGDDYEILFTAPADRMAALQEIAENCGVPITRIGVVRVGSGVRVQDPNGREIDIKTKSYQHF